MLAGFGSRVAATFAVHFAAPAVAIFLAPLVEAVPNGGAATLHSPGSGWRRYLTPLTSRPVKRTFPTPQDAEAAFYEALEKGELDAIMEVWAEDEDIVCIHPGGPRLVGYEQVRDSWAQIFRGGQRLRVQLTHGVVLAGMMLSVHSAHENITVPGEPRPRPPVVVTNVYLRTATGWRMIVHHASPAPVPPSRPGPDVPKVLH